MICYKVDIEIFGKFVNVGEISGNNHTDATFAYSKHYLNSNSAVPISLNLPLQAEKFCPEVTKNYFSGLLPEGFLRESIAQNMHISPEDYLSILLLLGQECLGSIIVYEDEKIKYKAEYEEITASQIEELASEGVSKSTSMVQEAHLSLTGASGKVGLYFDKVHDKWYLPKYTATSTHIVKQSHIRLKQIVINEILCLKTAKKLGIDVSEAFIIGQDIDNENILFATERFDRKLSDNKIKNLYKPYRLHQEDFGQALNINSLDKYETGNKSYFNEMINLIRSYSSNPMLDIEKLWKIAIFNVLIGNTDAHIKNFSLLYNPNLTNLTLAPAYDLVSTIIYPESTRNMAFSIGGERLIDNINRNSFIEQAKECKINPSLVDSWFDEVYRPFNNSLLETAAEIGLTATNLAKQILNLGVYNKQ